MQTASRMFPGFRRARSMCAPLLAVAAALCLLAGAPAAWSAGVPSGLLYRQAPQPPVDSVLKVAIGDPAPDFVLPALNGGVVRLSDYRGKRAVVLSFVPAAFTPVCSDQWPGYNMTRDEFERRGAILLGITTDNLPSLHAWTQNMGERMPGHGGEAQASPPPGGGATPQDAHDPAENGGVWFPVLSDFWPHGAAASAYGVLRRDGTAERALFVIDRQGIIRHIHVSDINRRPPLDIILRALDALPAP